MLLVVMGLEARKDLEDCRKPLRKIDELELNSKLSETMLIPAHVNPLISSGNQMKILWLPNFFRTIPTQVTKTYLYLACYIFQHSHHPHIVFPFSFYKNSPLSTSPMYMP